MELNRLSKVLFAVLVVLSLGMVKKKNILNPIFKKKQKKKTIGKGLHGLWPIYFFRFLLLFSSIIPISLRVNLDMAKTLYSLVRKPIEFYFLFICMCLV